VNTKATQHLKGAELERRVLAYSPKIRQTLSKARFIKAAVALGRQLEVHGLSNLATQAGLPVDVRGHSQDYQTSRSLLRHLIAAGIADARLEDCFVNDLGLRLDEHRYVIRLHPDLLGD
jgi:hypothetical protein